MSKKPLSLNTGYDPDDLPRIINEVQRILGTPITKLLNIPILNGQLLENVELFAALDNRIPTLLGRRYVGFIPVLPIGAAVSIYESESINNNKENYILLNITSNCVCSLWIF